jgi:hypothetical protein
MANVPVVTFPHFGDQPMLSDLITEAGAGIKIADYSDESEAINNGGEVKFSFKASKFTKKDVYDKFSEILTKPSYMENVGKMKVAGRAAGGREKTVAIIEDAYIHHMAAKPMPTLKGCTADVPMHLIDVDYQERAWNLSWCFCCWTILIVMGLILTVLINGFPGILNY